MPRTSVKPALSESDEIIGYDLFVDGEWHERYEFQFQAKAAQSAMKRRVTVNLHWRADNTVVLYMNGKKCVDGDHASMQKIAQGLVDEGKARWGRPTFARKG